MIQLEAITFAYPNGTCIFEDFSWQVAHGEAWAVVGPSGCGKTTLLHLLAGLVRPQAGRILIDGQVLRRPRPRTGLILQDYGLLPWATLRANVALGLDIRAFYGPDGIHVPKDEVLDDKEERVRYWMTRLGIHHLAGHYPHQVSGGQRQRAAIARTLALRPDILLMDEPFGALDALTRQDLMQLTMQLRREEGLTTVIVTHSIEEALYLGEYVLVLARPPHRVATALPNPHVGDAACRHDSAFLELCRQLRALMGESACEVA
jgi:ABC-type nitrate/sulfonate/bicarbonate transport system ATPase subunit